MCGRAASSAAEGTGLVMGVWLTGLVSAAGLTIKPVYRGFVVRMFPRGRGDLRPGHAVAQNMARESARIGKISGSPCDKIVR